MHQSLIFLKSGTRRAVRQTHQLLAKSRLTFQLASQWLVSLAAVIRVVTQCSSPTYGCSLELCIPFPLLLKTNNMHVTVSSCTNHISRYICRQRSRFPRNGSLLLIGQFKERNAELEWAAVSWGGERISQSASQPISMNQWVGQTIDLFSLYILFSHFRPRDALMGIFLLFFH